ncbi:hypothetical protein CYY_010048 [Polysphondylium violaceum]|uniref:Uncharacterized protein n=1 Tax=Polysphondylium violaceum TaxID=133409 RepID=A0A8J4V023_9MYCE|nr:hypothetical protein CYY_010048 [Polysphondylium violaceum]
MALMAGDKIKNVTLDLLASVYFLAIMGIWSFWGRQGKSGGGSSADLHSRVDQQYYRLSLYRLAIKLHDMEKVKAIYYSWSKQEQAIHLDKNTFEHFYAALAKYLCRKDSTTGHWRVFRV